MAITASTARIVAGTALIVGLAGGASYAGPGAATAEPGSGIVDVDPAEYEAPGYPGFYTWKYNQGDGEQIFSESGAQRHVSRVGRLFRRVPRRYAGCAERSVHGSAEQRGPHGRGCAAVPERRRTGHTAFHAGEPSDQRLRTHLHHAHSERRRIRGTCSRLPDRRRHRDRGPCGRLTGHASCRDRV